MDDGSRDGSREILSELEGEHSNLRVLLQPKTWEKARPYGAAFRKRPGIMY